MKRLAKIGLCAAVSAFVVACRADRIMTPAVAASPLIVDPCSTDPYADGCVTYSPPPPAPQGLNIGYSWNDCRLVTAATDLDKDGVNDGCERAMAAAFAPELVINTFECNFDRALDRMGGEYLYAVQLVIEDTGPRYRIVYMPGWYRDCGDPATGFGGHGGDSEYIIVDVTYRSLDVSRPYTWQTLQVFLSAHCGAWNGVDCQWWNAGYWERDGRWVNNVEYGAPVVWVSNSKHANYYSKGKCFTGSYGADDCLNNARTTRYPIAYAWQNVGSNAVPYAFELAPNDYAANGIPAHSGSPMTVPGLREHFWKTADADFRGWRGYDGSTPYGKILRDVAAFNPLPGIIIPVTCTPTTKVC
jgi:hypothetical protein